MKLLAVALVTVAVIALAALVGHRVDAGENDSQLRPCPTEDSSNCLWISRHGQSFVNVDGRIFPLRVGGRP